jgi:hypothetical protein
MHIAKQITWSDGRCRFASYGWPPALAPSKVRRNILDSRAACSVCLEEHGTTDRPVRYGPVLCRFLGRRPEAVSPSSHGRRPRNLLNNRLCDRKNNVRWMHAGHTFRVAYIYFVPIGWLPGDARRDIVNALVLDIYSYLWGEQ